MAQRLYPVLPTAPPFEPPAYEAIQSGSYNPPPTFAFNPPPGYNPQLQMYPQIYGQPSIPAVEPVLVTTEPEEVSDSAESSSSEDFNTTDYGLGDAAPAPTEISSERVPAPVQTAAGPARPPRVYAASRVAELNISELRCTLGAPLQAPPPGKWAKYLQPRMAISRTISDLKMRGANTPDAPLRNTVQDLLLRGIKLSEWGRYNNADPFVNREVWTALDELADDYIQDRALLEDLERCGWSIQDLRRHPDHHYYEAFNVRGERQGTMPILDVEAMWTRLLRWGFSRYDFTYNRDTWFHPMLFAKIGLTRLVTDIRLDACDLVFARVSSNELRRLASATIDKSPVPYMVAQMRMSPMDFAKFPFSIHEWSTDLLLTGKMIRHYELTRDDTARGLLQANGWSCKVLIANFSMTKRQARLAWYGDEEGSKKKKKKEKNKKKTPKPKKIVKQSLLTVAARTQYEKGAASRDT